MNIFSLL